MRRLIKFSTALFLLVATSLGAIAQTTTVVSGTVKNKAKEGVTAISVTIKGKNAGTFTDDKGNFKFSTTEKQPFTLVFSSVGFASKEIVYSGKTLDVELTESFVLGDEVVVSASRVPEKILESPVSVERISSAAIRQSSAPSYYDLVGNLKGVDVTTASLTFKSISTRGFNGSGNLRLNQIVDGMDNQAPGLNFAVGSFVGLTELDVDNIELLSGASSALYGPGGMNGTLLINSKNPFKYQGLSFQIKGGVNHIDNKQRNRSPFYDWSVRWAKKINDKWAFKIGAQLVQAQDWLAVNQSNYSRLNSSVIPGSRTTDPNYDGVNLYGDETTADISRNAGGVFNNIIGQVNAGVASSIGAAGLAALQGASNSFFGANPTATLPAYNTFLTNTFGAGINPLIANGGTLFLWGNGRGFFNNTQGVSRTGYTEQNAIDPNTVNVKLSGAVHYKINDRVEASIAGHYGVGSTVYTGSDRYSLKNLNMGQYKVELRGKNWYTRAYMTLENSGDSYNSTIATRIFNESWKPSGGGTGWYVQYVQAYTTALAQGANQETAHNSARGFADQGRPSGFLPDNAAFQKVIQTPISQGGGLFLDKTALYQIEGQWNVTKALGLDKKGTDFLVGGNYRNFWLNSEGTLFADKTPGLNSNKIRIGEGGAYAQLSQKLLNDRLKLSVSGRYDKNDNFEGRFTPRFSAVVKLAEGHNLRASYQEAYRFPSTQNQWINLLVSGGIRLMGGLPQLRNFYNFANNPAYTVASVQAFGATGNPALLVRQQFGEFKPEQAKTIEFGYKGLVANKLLIDVYYYQSTYKDFISSVNVIQSNTGSVANLGNNRTIYQISVNATGDVKTRGWGASVEYLLPKNFSVSGNVYSDEMTERPSDPTFITFYNTPKYRTNISFNNSGFLYQNRIGFGITYRWQDEFTYEGSFAVGKVPSFQTVDAMVSYKLPKTKSLLKLGASNLFNKYYINAFGNAQVGGLYYASFSFNVF